MSLDSYSAWAAWARNARARVAWAAGVCELDTTATGSTQNLAGPNVPRTSVWASARVAGGGQAGR